MYHMVRTGNAVNSAERIRSTATERLRKQAGVSGRPFGEQPIASAARGRHADSTAHLRLQRGALDANLLTILVAYHGYSVSVLRCQYVVHERSFPCGQGSNSSV